VLCDTSSYIISISDRRITWSLPVGGGYSRITITPSGDELILTGTEKKRLSIIQVTQVYDIPAGGSPVIGNSKATVTVTAFLDYQCPYCSKAYPLLEQLLAKYPNDVKLVIKNYPLKFHQSAEFESLVALAAGRQNTCKEPGSLLMQNSSKLSEQSIRQSAQLAGLNMEQFDAAVKDPALKKQIDDDMSLAARCRACS
jgi:protein-disulfide isomerase